MFKITHSSDQSPVLGVNPLASHEILPRVAPSPILPQRRAVASSSDALTLLGTPHPTNLTTSLIILHREDKEVLPRIMRASSDSHVSCSPSSLNSLRMALPVSGIINGSISGLNASKVHENYFNDNYFDLFNLALGGNRSALGKLHVIASSQNSREAHHYLGIYYYQAYTKSQNAAHLSLCITHLKRAALQYDLVTGEMLHVLAKTNSEANVALKAVISDCITDVLYKRHSEQALAMLHRLGAIQNTALTEVIEALPTEAQRQKVKDAIYKIQPDPSDDSSLQLRESIADLADSTL